MRRLMHMGVCFAVLAAHAVNAAEPSVQYTGVNIAGGEFAAGDLPGKYLTNYIFPDPATIDYFAGKGMNIIRVPMLWERLQHQLGGDLDPAEMARIDDVINYATSKGLRVILDVHNYAAYRGSMIGTKTVPTTSLGDLWRRIAERYKANDKVVFGLMNEPNNLKVETWLDAANAAVAGIRQVGAKNLILVPGVEWSSARSWPQANGDVMLNVKDSADNFIYEVHQYFNADWTGTTGDCQSEDIGITTLSPVTEWARQHGKRVFLGEVGVGSGQTCLDALDRTMRFMNDNSDVWLGWTYWAAGAWWPKDYFTSIQPLEGQDRPQMKVLEKYTTGN